MAITVTTKIDEVTGSKRMTCGIFADSAGTPATFDTGLSKVDSISLCPAPAAAPTFSGGTCTVATGVTGNVYYTCIGE